MTYNQFKDAGEGYRDFYPQLMKAFEEQEPDFGPPYAFVAYERLPLLMR